MLRVVFVRIHPEKVDRLRAWMRALDRRRAEVIETFEREGVSAETVHLLETAQGPVMVYAIAMDDAARADAAFAASRLPIDEEHRKVLDEVIAGKADVELLFEASAPSPA